MADYLRPEEELPLVLEPLPFVEDELASELLVVGPLR
jgi:hypothetical protein